MSDTTFLGIALFLFTASFLLLGKEIKNMKDALSALTTAVSDNTAATNAAVDALAAGTTSPATVQTITDAAAQIQKNNAALVNAIPPAV